MHCAFFSAGVYFLKWNDQSNFRDLFSMEWYVLGNGWDYSAVNPEDASNNTSPNDLGLFGLQFSEYYNGTGAGKASVPQQTSDDTRFNQVSNAEESAFKNLFTGKLDGQLYAPMRVDFGSLYASMAFRTSDRRQILLSWIFETAAGMDETDIKGCCYGLSPDWDASHIATHLTVCSVLEPLRRHAAASLQSPRAGAALELTKCDVLWKKYCMGWRCLLDCTSAL